MMTNYSISITELTREVTQQTLRVKILMGDLEEDHAYKKAISVMYLALGEAASKQFMDKHPHTALWDLRAQQLKTLCKECFRKKKELYSAIDFFPDFNNLVNLYLSFGMLSMAWRRSAISGKLQKPSSLICSYCTCARKKAKESSVPSPRNPTKLWSSPL